ncbi:MAG: hypothetical protein B1H03_03420 [Planctomycetales bacterium 4484_113]|nr:MAG: hypothetical protein B1H03_03420 [Planctomycetales bacterium 4484_113]
MISGDSYTVDGGHSPTRGAGEATDAAPTEACSGQIILDGSFALDVRVEMQGSLLWRIILGSIREVTASSPVLPLTTECGEASPNAPIVLALLPRLLSGRVRFAVDSKFRLLDVLTMEGERVGHIRLANVLTSFQRRVFAVLLKVPAGETRTYRAVAEAVGSSPRAVGQALARNPLPLLVPCHRVVAGNHKLGGFSAPDGARLKRLLLAAESSAQGASGTAQVEN